MKRMWNQNLKLALVASFFALPLFSWTTLAVERAAGLTCDLILSEMPISIEEATALAVTSLERHGSHLKFDEYGLLIPNKSAETTQKIATNLNDLKQQIENAVQRGQHVLFLSGSYDLVHQEHALFVAFAVDSYLNLHNISRDQLFVVATADGDDLLGVGKASKYIGNGGKEPFQRPVQRAEVFNSATHPRALDLATLPVDAVLMTPSPRELQGSVFAEEGFQNSASEILSDLESRISQILQRNLSDPEKYWQQIQDVRTLESSIRAMSRLIVQGQSDYIINEFLSSQDVERAKKSPVWHLSAWNFILYSYLASEIEDLKNFSRVLNVADSDYLSVVSTMQNLTGMNVLLMPEKQKNISTTELLKIHGAEALVQAKQRYHND